MYLSKLEIVGFKSFAQKIKLDFKEGLTCIIGPNGSGKSNIVDAIRWVLGEQRVSSLRSDKMENVIFNGTKKRKPMGMAEVSMTIENNKKILDSTFDEIVISRRLYRSGESQYLINHIPVRLKDVVNLFMDTGMGANSYSVIELKMIESILSENKAERRLLFEEAAGVVKYKTRRKSALRRLDATQQDLTRINDIVIEVEKTVASLGRQVSKAKKYIEFTDQLKKGEIDLAVFRYHNLKDKITPMELELKEISKEKEESSHQITLEEAILEDYNTRLVAFEQKVQTINSNLYNMDREIQNFKHENELAETKIEDMQRNRERYLREIDDYSKKTVILEENKNSFGRELETYQIEYDELQQQFEEIANERNEKAEQLNKEKNEIEQLNARFRKQLQHVTSQKEQIKQKEFRLKFDSEQIEKIQQQNNEQDNELSSLTSQLSETKTAKEKSEQLLIELKEAHNQSANKEEELKNSLTQLLADRNIIISDLERVRSRETFLKNIITNYEGYSKSTQFVMSQKEALPGVIGPLSELIETNNECAPLLEAILKDAINYIVVESTSSAKNLLDEIKQKNQGRVTCIPLDRIEPIALNQPKDLRFLVNEINCDVKYRDLISLLLGDVVISPDLEGALSLAKQYPAFRYITPEKEIISYNRELSGGHSEKQEDTIIGRKTKLKELGKHHKRLQTELEEIEKKINSNEQQIEETKKVILQQREELDDTQKGFYLSDNTLKQLSYQIETKRKQLESADTQTAQLKSQVESFSKEINEISGQLEGQQEELNNIERETIKRTNAFEDENEQFQILMEEYQDFQLKISNIQNQINNRSTDLKRIDENRTELNNNITKRKSEIESIKSTISQLQNDIEQRTLHIKEGWDKRDELDNKKQEMDATFQELKEKRHQLETEIREFRRKHDNSLEKSKKLEIQINELQFQSDNIRSHITQEHSVDIDAQIPNINIEEDVLEQTLETLKFKIKNLGPVNPLAVAEHEKESERLNFLTTQRDDLLKAEESLLDTIDKINKTARQQFTETYADIKTNFEKVFLSFFPNGTGTLVLNKGEDPLEADIDIEVTTKGRSLQTLSLLSGGEKTLTAISLLFAIYLVKPSPFCILDEVDAPLDDLNIGRFTDALGQFSDHTQFLIVTHNKRTMEAGETMYGVTMEEEGVSKLVSVQFN